MELDEFVKSVIVSVYSGIQKAKEETGKEIIPSNCYSASDSIPCVSTEEGFQGLMMVSNIQFEVTLTNTDKEDSKAGIGVLLGTFNIGAKGSIENEQSALTKARFNVPISLT